MPECHIYRLNVYCDNFFEIYFYRTLILTQDISSVDRFMLFVYFVLSGPEKNKKRMSFQGALAGPMEVSDCHLALYSGPCSQMLPHHLGQQVLRLFQHGLTQA